MLLELYKQRNRTIVFKSNSVVDKMKLLQEKLVNEWTADDLNYIISMYKKSSIYKYSIDAEYDAIKAQDKMAKIRERFKSKDSIMNLERTTTSQDIRASHQREFRQKLEAEKSWQSTSRSPPKAKTGPQLSTIDDERP
jgi:hypothetical protein